MNKRLRRKGLVDATSTERESMSRSPGAQAAEHVATAVVGVGLLSFVCISCIGVVLGAFGVASVIGFYLSPWTLMGVPIVGYGLWRWQRRRLECRLKTNRQTADSG